MCGWMPLLLVMLAATGARADELDRRWLRQVDDPRALGLEMLREGNLIQAKELLERARQFDTSDPRVRDALVETYVRLGRERLGEGNTVEAGYFLEQALEIKPDDADAWLTLGRARYQEEDLDQAVEAWLEAERRGQRDATPALVRAYVDRADKRIDFGQLPQADLDIEEALRRAQADPEARLVLGRLRLSQGRPGEAVSPLQTAARTPAFFGPAQVMLALAYQGLNFWLDSIRAATEAAGLPEYVREAHYIQARSYYSWGLEAYRDTAWAVAEHRFFRAVELDPQWDDPQFSGALAQVQQGKGREAKAVLDPLYARRPDYPGIPTLLAQAGHLVGETLIGERQYGEAVRILREAFGYDERIVAILLTLGEAEEKRGQFPAALAAYRDGLARGADPVAANRGAMRVLQDHLDRWLEALVHAEDLLVLAPGDEDAVTRIRTITRAEGLLAHRELRDEAAVELLTRHRDFVDGDAEVNFAWARSLVNLLRYAEALDVAEALYTADSGRRAYADLLFEARVGLADEATLASRWEQARDHYARALQIRPRADDVRFRYGQALLALRDWPAASRELRAVWVADPGLHARAARPLAEALAGWARSIVDEQAAQAVELAAEAIVRDPDYPPSYLVRSEGYEQLGRLAEAIEDGERYLRRAASDPKAQPWLEGLLRAGAAEAERLEQHAVVEERARRLLELRPRDHEATWRLGHALFLQRRWSEAEPLLREVAAGGQFQAEATLDLARGFAAADNPEEASKYYLTVRRLRPGLASNEEQVAAFRAAARRMASVERPADAARYWGFAVQVVPDDPEIGFEYGRALWQIDRHGEAVPHLRRAHAVFPTRREVAVVYGQALVGAGDPLLATRIYEPWEAPTQRGRAEAERLAGEAYLAATRDALRADDMEKAGLYAERASRRLDDNPEPWYILGEVRYRQENWEDALKAFFRVHDLDPSYKETIFYLSDIWVKRGDLYLEARQWNLARGAFGRALEYASSLEANYGMLRVAMAESKYEEALGHAEAVARERRGYRDTWDLRLEALRRLGDAAVNAQRPDDALRWYAQLRELEPGEVAAWYIPGLIHTKAGRFVEGIPMLERVRSLAGLDYEALRALLIEAYGGDLVRRYEAGDWYNALEVGEKLLAIDANQPNAHYWRGRVYEVLQRPQAAIEAYRAGLRLPVPGPEDMLDRLSALYELHPDLAPEVEPVVDDGPESEPAADDD